ncbi:hypothetical protein [Cerasicoccus fimbriatus]|uniref:hypothetical protein n=1 Tax=Cerasicoccus fimbriatus TaxID=3014554 RepID=UPI0022B3903A|nr:hypothetical protein [Cerasicoccus sp. TK19100]
MPVSKLPLFVTLLFSLFTTSLVGAQTRTWTDKQGRGFEGLLLRHDKESVFVERTSDKRQFTLPRSTLSDADNVFLDELDRQERLKEFLKDTPTNYDDAFEKSVDEQMPMLIFYRNGAGYAEFDAMVAKFLTDPQFQERIKDKLFVVVVKDKDVSLEGLIYSHVDNSSNACMSLIKETRVYGNRSFVDMPTDRFLDSVDGLWKNYNQSIH